LRGRSKNYVENLLIFIIIIVISWAIYHYFLSSYIYTNYLDESTDIKKVQNEYIDKLNSIKVAKRPKLEQTKNIPQLSTDDNNTDKNITADTNQTTQKATLDINTTDSTATIYSYYTNLQKAFVKLVPTDNIDQNIRQKVTIKLTILKDGNFEYPHKISGDKRYYDIVAPIVIAQFPLTIPPHLQDKFPRYFTLKVEK